VFASFLTIQGRLTQTLVHLELISKDKSVPTREVLVVLAYLSRLNALLPFDNPMRLEVQPLLDANATALQSLPVPPLVAPPFSSC